MQNRRIGGTAAVIVEPVGPERARGRSVGYNAAVRELCDEFGALLIFDEVVSGFRLGLGGAQGYSGCAPTSPSLASASPAATRWPAASAGAARSWRASPAASAAERRARLRRRHLSANPL